MITNKADVVQWSKKPCWLFDDDTGYCSVVFTWQIDEVIKQIKQGWMNIRKFIVGGPAAILKQDELRPWCEVSKDPPSGWNPLLSHNNLATFTTRGCPNGCEFCAVPKIEGELVELNEWEPKPIVCDNNLLAASRKHFDRVIDSLKSLPWCDFNQGLDAGFFKPHHANRIAELKNPFIRFACDSQTDKKTVFDAVRIALDAGLKKISIYMLFGYKDTPDEALDRVLFIQNELGFLPFPMRYQPLDADKKNDYVDPSWTEEKLLDFGKYWSSHRFFVKIPFNEFNRKKRKFGDNRQINMEMETKTSNGGNASAEVS